MKTRFLSYIVTISLIASLAACRGSAPQPQNSGNVTVVEAIPVAKDGLNLQAVGELAKRMKNAGELERNLNRQCGPNEVPGPNNPCGINQLDLDRDNKVETLKVTESTNGTANAKLLSLTAILSSDGSQQHIADIQFERPTVQQAQVGQVAQPQYADMQITGNPQIYGDGYYYHSHFSFVDALLLAWLFSPRPYYMSPITRFGYYGVYSPMPVVVYQRTVVNTYTRNSTLQQVQQPMVRNRISSPESQKSSNSIKASLAHPTESQKNFQRRIDQGQIKTGAIPNAAAGRQPQVLQRNSPQNQQEKAQQQPAGQQRQIQTAPPAQQYQQQRRAAPAARPVGGRRR